MLPATSEQPGWPWNEEVSPLPPLTPDGKPWPKITIVTPSYNQGQFIEETIRSILLQNYPNLEYIIIDGGSTDNSVEVIKKYEPWLSYWVSEPDRGQAHAINKGFSMATGEIIQWINSDDLLTLGALAEVGYLASASPDHLIGGGCLNFDEKGDDVILINQGLSQGNLLRHWRRDKFIYQQPALFVPYSAFARCGYLDESMHYCFDYEWTIRLLSFCRPVYTPKKLARFRWHPNSKTVSQPNKFLDELNVVFHRYWPGYSELDLEREDWMHNLDGLLLLDASQKYKL